MKKQQNFLNSAYVQVLCTQTDRHHARQTTVVFLHCNTFL